VLTFLLWLEQQHLAFEQGDGDGRGAFSGCATKPALESPHCLSLCRFSEVVFPLRMEKKGVRVEYR